MITSRWSVTDHSVATEQSTKRSNAILVQCLGRVVLAKKKQSQAQWSAHRSSLVSHWSMVGPDVADVQSTTGHQRQMRCPQVGVNGQSRASQCPFSGQPECRELASQPAIHRQCVYSCKSTNVQAMGNSCSATGQLMANGHLAANRWPIDGLLLEKDWCVNAVMGTSAASNCQQ